MERQGSEDAQKWSDGLSAPLPGRRIVDDDEFDPSESDQLKYL